jgi:excisionase family DNA binding protein
MKLRDIDKRAHTPPWTLENIPERFKERFAALTTEVAEALRRLGFPEPQNDEQWRLLATVEKKFHPDPAPKAYAGVDLLSEGLLPPSKAATFCGVSRATLYRAMGRGDLPFFRVGKLRRVPIAALRIWLTEY